MTDVFARLEAARRACAEALDRLSVRVPVPDGDGATMWDSEGAAQSLDRVNEAFRALGDLAELHREVGPSRTGDLEVSLRALARVHALLTVSVAREKDALRDRLLLTQSAAKGYGWHATDAAGRRCNLSG